MWSPPGRRLVLPALLCALLACGRVPEEERALVPAQEAGELVEAAPVVTPGGTERSVGQDGMTLLLDGQECADPGFHVGLDQPAAIVRLTEDGAGTALLLIDVGVSPEALRNNLGRWFAQQGLPPGLPDPALPRAILFSHVHTFGDLMAPLGSFAWMAPGESLREAQELLGVDTVQGPNRAGLCDGDVRVLRNPAARALCDGAMRETEPGLAPVRYTDGTASRRAWTLTYPIAPGERGELAWQPEESVFIFRTGEGYLVYSVCSHALQPGPGPRDQRPLPGIELVQDRIDAEELPPGPIHTLVTGACGMDQMLTEFNGGAPMFIKEDPERLAGRLRALSARTGLRRVYLHHCARHFEQFWPVFMDVFGAANVQRALPGSWIAL